MHQFGHDEALPGQWMSNAQLRHKEHPTCTATAGKVTILHITVEVDVSIFEWTKRYCLNTLFMLLFSISLSGVAMWSGHRNNLGNIVQL